MSLPSGYIQHLYIESSGTQYIDTGVIPSTDIGIEVDFMLTEAQSTGGIVGAEQVWPSNMYCIDAWAYRYGTVYEQHTLTANVRYYTVLQNGVFYQNGTEVLTGKNGKSMTIPLYLFALITLSGPKEYAKARIYSCKISSGGVLVRDFIPCTNPSGEVGMWDSVNDVFYGSSGTGSLTAGMVIPSVSDDFIDITPAMTSANTPAGYAVTASSTHSSYLPWYAFDSVDSNPANTWRAWHSSAGMPQWIMLEFPEAVKVSAFSITNRADFGDYDTKGILSFSLEGSNNGTSFTTLGTYTRAGDFSLTTVHTVEKAGEYRFYRIYITQAGYVYNGTQYAVIEQIRFYKSVLVIPDAPENLEAVYTDGTLSLSWTASQNAAGYRIFRDGAYIGETAETSFTDTGAEMYGVYTYTVAGYSADGEGNGASVRVRIPGSSDVLADLITDRTAEDIWNRTAKGVYNARDLNRVSTAAAYVRAMLADYGYLCGTDARADWAANEIPRTSDLRKHHLSVTALDVIRYARDPVRLPQSLEKLTWEDANAIEAFLLSCGRAAERIPESWVFAGECICGEI